MTKLATRHSPRFAYVFEEGSDKPRGAIAVAMAGDSRAVCMSEASETISIDGIPICLETVDGGWRYVIDGKFRSTNIYDDRDRLANAVLNCVARYGKTLNVAKKGVRINWGVEAYYLGIESLNPKPKGKGDGMWVEEVAAILHVPLEQAKFYARDQDHDDCDFGLCAARHEEELERIRRAEEDE